MSLLADIRDTVRSLTADPKDNSPSPAPIPFTSESDRGWGGTWGSPGGPSMRHDLDLTTSESTLMSVLQLISGETASVEWTACRKQARPDPNKTSDPITAEQSLAVKLWHKPNRFMSGVHVRKVCTWHYAAVGEAWMVWDFWDEARTLPRGWWPVRPDRMIPVPDPDLFLAGYIYTGPSGERIPLELDEVMRITNPHPVDPHRGIGAVQTLGTALGTSMSSQQWINAFFRNDATPGGIIQVEEGLEDAEYNKLRKRWSEQHRGVNKAHRVAILEYGKWIPQTVNMKELQFTEIRQLTRDQVLEAFRIHKHMMGASDDVNLANATAADSTFAKRTTLTNLRAWSALGNGDYIDAFGTAGREVLLKFDNPVPEDEAAEQAALASKVDAVVKLVTARFDPVATLEAMGLPPIPMVVEAEPTPEPVEQPPAPAPVVEDEPDKPTDKPGDGELDESKKGDPLAVAVVGQKLYLSVEGNKLLTRLEGREIMRRAGADIVPEDWDDTTEDSPLVIPGGIESDVVPPPAPGAPSPVPGDPDSPAGDEGPVPAGDSSATAGTGRRLDAKASPADDVDLTQLGEDWDAALEKVLAKWPAILSKQYSDLEKQVKKAIDSGDLEALLELTAPDSGSAVVLTAALVAVAVTGGKSVEREAKAQGVPGVKPVAPPKADLEVQAKVVTALLRQSLATSAGREALRVASPDLDGATVAGLVRDHLDALTDAQPREFLGGALTGAQNAGRAATFAEGPTATYYASEQLDTATCSPCRAENGKKLGGTVADAVKDYPNGGYTGCEGRSRCRGTFVAQWEIGEEE